MDPVVLEKTKALIEEQVQNSSLLPKISNFFLTEEDLIAYFATVANIDGGTVCCVGTNNLYNIYIYNSDKEVWQNLGQIRGEKGEKGNPGESIQGPAGTAGKDGARGATWFYGTTINGEDTSPLIFVNSNITSAIIGDYYLNTINNNVYYCFIGGDASTAAWGYITTLKGDTGKKGENGKDGVSGKNGEDGFSPEIVVTQNNLGYNIKIQDKNGTKTIDLLNGINGLDGNDGTDGFSPSIDINQTNAGIEILITNKDSSKLTTIDFPVLSVNSQTGIIKLTANDVEALPSSLLIGNNNDNAGAHNSIYRGKNLGTEVTKEQWNAIQAGTFEDLYIGDYWIINDITWRIAAFDYYLNTGPQGKECTTHHVTIVPDNSLGAIPMADTNTTATGYIGSKAHAVYLAENLVTTVEDDTGEVQTITQDGTGIAKIKEAFGDNHILTYYNILNSGVLNGRQSATVWVQCKAVLMTEQNVFGTSYFSTYSDGTTIPFILRIDNSQFPLFALNHKMIASNKNDTRLWYWLRDPASDTQFCIVDGQGIISYYIASAINSTGVAGYASLRPSFSIIGPADE